MKLSLSARLRLLKAALKSDNGVFFPYEFFDQARQTAALGYPELEPHFAQQSEAFSFVLGLIEKYRGDLEKIGKRAKDSSPNDGSNNKQAPAPRWGQNWFPPLDAAVAYALTRHHRPTSVIEVGGGHSSRFFARAARDEGLSPRHVVIDPGLRASEKIAGLALTHVSSPLESADLSIFSSVKSGDIVSLDGSHKLLPGSDVDVFVGRVLPRLASGVLVHVHDCFLPDGYPRSWDHRVYNEQSALLGLIAPGSAWACVFASHYVATRMKAAVERGLVGAVATLSEAMPSGIWLRRA